MTTTATQPNTAGHLANHAILPSYNVPQDHTQSQSVAPQTGRSSSDVDTKERTHEKGPAHVVEDGQPVVHTGHVTSQNVDDLPESRFPSMSEVYTRYKILFHLALVALLLGWWIPGIVRKETRHKWVITTIWTWFFILLIFFQWVPSSIFFNPVKKVWKACVSQPFFKLPYYARLGMGWIGLLALVFGSAFGVKLQPGTEYKDRVISVFGLFVFQFCFWLSCPNKKLIQWNTVIVGLGLQQIIALLVLKTTAGFKLFNWIANAATDLLEQGTNAGGFFFSAAILENHYFFINTLSAIIFFLALVQLLYYLGVMQWVLLKFATFFYNVMGVSGAEAVVAAASPFIGQGESAALVKPFVAYMTPAELHQAMASGFSTISGSVLGAYIAFGMPAVNLVTSAVMSIPASLAISKLRMPETGEPLTKGKVTIVKDDDGSTNMLHAFSNGAWFGLRVAGMILCNVLVVLALLYTVDGLLAWIGQFWGIDRTGPDSLSLELIFGYVLYPVAWLMGVPKSDLLTVSRLLATKLIANEFVAYTKLSALKETMTERGFLIATFALCGFGNLASVGIQVGVLGSLAPNKKAVISKVAISALISGYMATIQTATIAGMIR